jgi:V8-like Glu-specific endopeptidase
VSRAGTQTRARYQALFVGLVLIVVTSGSVAAADDGPGPLGVTTVAADSAQSRRVGALFARGRAGDLTGHHFCTASVVHSSRRDLLVTAAHCLAGAADGPGLVFVPGYRDGRAPYGIWTVIERYVPGGWVRDRDEDSDLAFAVVAPRDGRNVEDAVGGNRFVTGVATGASVVTVTGYPGSREKPVSCRNRPVPVSRTQQRVQGPEFTGGTSGSPWVDGHRQVFGVLGGHEEGGSTPDTSYSVVFGAEAAGLYRKAAGDPP